MQSRGFTLIEMLVTIGISSLLAAIVMNSYREYMRRYQMESQTRTFHFELLKARMTAVTEHKDIMVKVYADHFNIYSSAESGPGVSPVLKKTLQFPVCWAYAMTPGGAVNCQYTYDQHGVANYTGSICIDDDATGAVDSIVVYTTRTALGKRASGGDCKSDFITQK